MRKSFGHDQPEFPAMSLAEQVTSVRAMFERYDNVPASLADA